MYAMSNAQEPIRGRSAFARNICPADREKTTAREPVAAWLARAYSRFAAWREKRRSLRALKALPDHILEDIGFRRVDALGRARGVASTDAAREMFMPIWRDDPLFTIQKIEDGTAGKAVAAETTTDSRKATKRPIQAAIARIWRGRTKPERAGEYETYLHDAGIKPLIRKALGVQLFREDRPSESEFVTISYWESVEAMSRFTGGEPTRIHHLPRDAEFLIELPERVQILDIRAAHGNR